MDRTHAVDNVAVLPAPAPAGTPGYYGPGTTVNHEDMNGFKEALCVPLEDGGVTLDKDNYTQFATLLSGVHGIVSSVRTNLATTGASTYDKKAAMAVEGAVCTGIDTAAIAGKTQTVSQNYSAAIAGQSQTIGATHSIALAGTSQTVNGATSAAVAGTGQTVTGNQAAAIAGVAQNVKNAQSSAMAGNNQIITSGAASVISGQYYELVDNYCIASGYGTSAPANHGDGLTNKNLSHYLNAQTGEVRHLGDLKIGGNVNDGTGYLFKAEATTGLTYQPKLKKTSAVTINGGVSAAAIAWADYANEPTIEIEYQITCTNAGGETVNHGTAIQLALPASWPVEHVQSISNHIGAGVSGAYWHANVDCTANTVDLYLSGANAAYAAGATQTINLILHRCDPT
jgi:hypothetical protein